MANISYTVLQFYSVTVVCGRDNPMGGSDGELKQHIGRYWETARVLCSSECVLSCENLVNFTVSLLDTACLTIQVKITIIRNMVGRWWWWWWWWWYLSAVGPVVQCSTLLSPCLALLQQSLECRSSRSCPSVWTNQSPAELAAVAVAAAGQPACL